MTRTEQKNAAKKFADYWKDRGYEKGESQKFGVRNLSHSIVRCCYECKHKKGANHDSENDPV